MEGYSYQTFISILFLLAIFSTTTSVQGQSTRIGFYSLTCPRAESIVQSTVAAHFRSDPTIAPGLLRMHFHDCFVQGCDASILIDGTSTEKTAGANSRVRGFDVIDDAKTQLESACPGVVSCADILALAARDSVVLTNGPSWQVPTGRRDGRISLASDVNLPSPFDTMDAQKQKFADKGLNTQDLVTLVGGHTIGTATCQFLTGRLYNVTSANGADPSIDPSFVPQLQANCPFNGNPAKLVQLDTGSSRRFDTNFFTNLQKGRGILDSDQKLWTDASTKTFVQGFLGVKATLNFNIEFGKSMVKMSNIGVKTGTQGEIRKICTAINS